ncbi:MULTISPECIES: hypothetical protein [unclassified Endozoicomonas]|uniref:hypothetical protein n=1 Tax=unclassified Endozoicomonas TaxID=2644528 RepID=UPI0021492C2A|nr:MULTISPECIES: hypothetical protein [unclassified Endozoicomonas]
MGAKSKPQSTEIDHIRNTLTDVVDGLGQTRSEMHQRFDQQSKETSERFDQQDKRLDQQGSDIAAIKEMLQALLSRQ